MMIDATYFTMCDTSLAACYMLCYILFGYLAGRTYVTNNCEYHHHMSIIYDTVMVITCAIASTLLLLPPPLLLLSSHRNELVDRHRTPLPSPTLSRNVRVHNLALEIYIASPESVHLATVAKAFAHVGHELEPVASRKPFYGLLEAHAARSGLGSCRLGTQAIGA